MISICHCRRWTQHFHQHQRSRQHLLPLLVLTLCALLSTNVESFAFTHTPNGNAKTNGIHSSQNFGTGQKTLPSFKRRRFVVSTTTNLSPSWSWTSPSSSSKLNLKSKHNMEELQRAARDPKAFEAYVLKRKLEQETTPENSSNSDLDQSDSDSPVNKKKASTSNYVPIEQWDEERGKNEDSLTWEEKVQFDGLRNGNRYKQNEILRHHLR